MAKKDCGIEIRSYDIAGAIDMATGIAGWIETTGPSTGCGPEWWYRKGTQLAYAYLDQDELLSIEVTDDKDEDMDDHYDIQL